MIKNFVFDLGNVLIDFNPRRIVNAVFTNETEQQFYYREIFLTKAWKQLDQGLISFDTHYQNLVAQYPQYAKEIGWILDNWHKDLPPIPGMFTLIETLYNAGFDLYLLSNASMRYYTYALSKFNIFEFFKGITISAELKLIKPHKEIYDRFCQIHSLSPGECLFIDDQLKNVEAAINAGWHGVQFIGANDLRCYLEKTLSLQLPGSL